MSGTFSIGAQSAVALAGAAYCALQNIDAVPGQRLRVYEVGFTTNSNTLASVGLAMIAAGNLGTPSGTPIVLTADDDADLTKVMASIATTWSVAPTLPTVYKRPFSAGAVQGSGYVWQFPDGLILSPTAGLALVNFGVATGPSLSVWFSIRQ